MSPRRWPGPPAKSKAAAELRELEAAARRARARRRCTFCGCTPRRACPGGCSWSGTIDLRSAPAYEATTLTRWLLASRAGGDGLEHGDVCTACAQLAVELGLLVLRFFQAGGTRLDRWDGARRKATLEQGGAKPAKTHKRSRGARK